WSVCLVLHQLTSSNQFPLDMTIQQFSADAVLGTVQNLLHQYYRPQVVKFSSLFSSSRLGIARHERKARPCSLKRIGPAFARKIACLSDASVRTGRENLLV